MLCARVVRRVGHRRPALRCCTSQTGKSGESKAEEPPRDDKWFPKSEMFTYDEGKVFVLGHYNGGFKVNNKSRDGPILLLPNYCFRWAIRDVSDVTEASTAMMRLLDPAPEVLILGCGHDVIPLHSYQNAEEAGNKFPNLGHVHEMLRKNGTRFEVMDTVNAAATFNVLNAENRRVAAALMPCQL